MAFVAIGDRIKETTISTGTGDILLAGAAPGYKAFSTAKRPDGTAIVDGDYVPYVITDVSGDEETGVGRWNSVANSITRLEVKSSSNANALVALPSGSKDVFLSVLASALSPHSHLIAHPPSPNSISGLMARYSARSSQIDRADGYVTKWYDISGNNRHSDVAAGTARPFFLQRGFNRGHAGIRFNGTSHRLTFSAIPGLASPLNCTIVAVVQNYSTAFGTVNRHLVNWSGNPIIFLGTGPGYIMYNGTTVTEVAAYTQATTELPKDIDTHPFVLCCAFNGSGNTGVMAINGTEYTGPPGTAATGTTNSFTLGSDSAASPSNFGGFIIHELLVYNKSLSAAERQQILDYFRSVAGVSW